MEKKQAPDSTAVRVALWRAMHVQVDPPPHILEDEIGLKLAQPNEDWRSRPDMHPQGTSGYRAGVVARSRLIEDLVEEQAARGVGQYVILGAGLDSFAQRKPELAARLQVFEIDKPETQQWKRGRLSELGFGTPAWLKFVPVDFEEGESWLEKLRAQGFDSSKPAVIASAGVSMYLTKEAIKETLREVAALAPGSTFLMTFLLPVDLLPAGERAQNQALHERARAAGTPFLSFFSPKEILSLAREAGFHESNHISGEEITRRYFSGRSDGLKPAKGEEFLKVTVPFFGSAASKKGNCYL